MPCFSGIVDDKLPECIRILKPYCAIERVNKMEQVVVQRTVNKRFVFEVGEYTFKDRS
jgi:hypothetical protein